MNGGVLWLHRSHRRTFVHTLQVLFSCHECFIGTVKRQVILHSTKKSRTTSNSPGERVVGNPHPHDVVGYKNKTRL
jgi:hypothetical protein